MPVGLLDDAEYPASRVRLGEGDRLLIYSDGATECPDPGGRFLEEEGLARLLRRHAGTGGTGFLDAMARGVEEFAGRRELPDDLSAVLVERVSRSGRSPAG